MKAWNFEKEEEKADDHSDHPPSRQKVQRYYKYKYNTYNLHSAESKLLQIPHDFSYDHTLKSSGAILQIRSGSTA